MVPTLLPPDHNIVSGIETKVKLVRESEGI